MIHQYKKQQRGFALLEVMLAVVVLSLTVTGAWYFYKSTLTQQKNTRLINEVIALSTVFNDLYNTHLTSDVSNESALINLFYSSQRLPVTYFNISDKTTEIVSSYGKLSFSEVGSTTFTVTVPVSDKSDGQKNQICDGVMDHVASCEANDDASVTIVVDAGG